MTICRVTVESTYGVETFRVLSRNEFNLIEESTDARIVNVPEDCEMGKAIIKALQQHPNSFVCAETMYQIKRYKIGRDSTGNNAYFPRIFDFTARDNPPVVYVYRNSAICPTCKARGIPQSIENVSATMMNISGEIIHGISLQFCRNCKKYFIDWQSLKLYNKEYGTLFFERNIDDVHGDNYWDFNPDSILSRNGYAADGSMNSEERQKCLVCIIETGVATKSMIINHLSKLLDLNSSRCYLAAPRWLEDLRFINHYNVERQRYIGVVTALQRVTRK